MAISVAVCETFNVKEWHDLVNRVRVRSRSLEMASFDKNGKGKGKCIYIAHFL